MTDVDRSRGLAGTLTPHGHLLPVRVYFEDTDFTGVVYHARYLHFFERGRSDFLRLRGVNHTELGDGRYGEALFFAVKSIALDFHATARIDDVLVVETAIEGHKGARLLIRQKIARDDRIIASADVSVVLLNEAGRPRRMPDRLLHALLA